MSIVTDDRTARAGALLDLWGRLSMQHVALGAACGCGVGGISLRLDDFELDIVGYLEDAALRSDVDEVTAFFEAMSRRPARPRPLVSLLKESQRDQLPDAVVEWLLPKIERTLRSFADLHGTRAAG